MRYFIELAYHGRGYAGFQVQDNAITIQSEMEKALEVIFRRTFSLTGSSRTDAGVHARQNFFHFDADLIIGEKQVYNLNAILPASISIKAIHRMWEDAHCRFDATSRLYRYYLYGHKDPFLTDRAWYYPYPLDINRLNEAASVLKGDHDFTSFSKRKTQVKTMACMLQESYWAWQDGLLVYTVRANRFLRGMVRGLVATMLLTGRGKISLDQFMQVLEAKDCSRADFSAPAHGLFLEQVSYPDGYFL